MKQLIRIVRNHYTPEVSLVTDQRVRRWPWAILPKELSVERSDFAKEGEFFLVEEDDVELFLKLFAEANPGHEVQVYTLTQSAQCPAGPMVVKKVTKDGVLPDTDNKKTSSVVQW